jgi:formylglycine-generating enzyme
MRILMGLFLVFENGRVIMSFIPGGMYLAGKVDALYEMSINALCVDKYEVTQGDYERVIGNNPSKFNGSNRPVEQVSWHDAKSYCQKVGKRLPTEWEWEFAARGGVPSSYYWGDNYDGAYAWTDKNSGNTTHPVGQKKPNRYGLYDMAGNVFEWTSSDYDSGTKVLRGGSWYGSPNGVRSAYRVRYGPSARDSFIGFRCAQ